MSIISLLWSSLTALPLIVVCLVGAAMTIARWRRHPSISAITLCALGLLLIAPLTRVVGIPIMLYLATSDFPGEVASLGFLAINIVSSILSAGGVALLLWAIFTRRDTRFEKHSAKPDVI